MGPGKNFIYFWIRLVFWIQETIRAISHIQKYAFIFSAAVLVLFTVEYLVAKQKMLQFKNLLKKILLLKFFLAQEMDLDSEPEDHIQDEENPTLPSMADILAGAIEAAGITRNQSRITTIPVPPPPPPPVQSGSV